VLRHAKQQQAAIGGLGAAVEIYCEFLAVDRWQVERERRIAGHGSCGVALIARSKALDTDLLCESATSRYSRRKFHRMHNPGPCAISKIAAELEAAIAALKKQDRAADAKQPPG
jgi:hypothetical protein